VKERQPGDYKSRYLRIVKKITAIFLLSIYLFSVVQLYELLKINVLIAHFYETRQQEPNIGFFDFLVMHYITDDRNTQDNDRDSQLPFKSNCSLIANNSSIFLLSKYDESVAPLVIASKVDFPRYITPFISSSFCSLVWNPPRIS
jgi:hypothetical protein